MNEISILIPTYNDVCTELVTALAKQARAIKGLTFEILVADDGSTDPQVVSKNKAVGEIEGCDILFMEKNVGRAVIRNYLARQSRYKQLLFVDADMTIIDDCFLKHYLDHAFDGIVYGGYVAKGDDSGNLRWNYERACADKHTAEERRKHPYLHFHTSNFMIPREVMMAHPLDERFRYYGYEDVFYGKELRRAGIEIRHINNPVGFLRFESNADFVKKTEEGLRTLNMFQLELSEYSTLLKAMARLRQIRLSWLPRLIYRKWGEHMKANLYSMRPSLKVFQLYKLCYFAAFKAQKD